MVNRARRRAGRRARAAAAVLAAAALASSCMANPDDAPLVEGEAGPGAEVPDGPVDPEDPTLELHVGVDDFGEGFNPHLSADATPVTDLVASLTLPSAFVPAVAAGTGTQATGLTRNTDLLLSAGPVDDDGDQLVGARGQQAVESGSFRIRYVIAPEAQWSDGTPVSGADFRYLHEGMISTPGVREAAAYEAIRAIHVSDGGRTVDVDIAGPLPQWRTLFSHLLPSHLLRPTGTPFADVLDTAIVASGGTYVAESVDVARREIRLVRNSRFWGEEPPLTERIIIRHDRGPVDGAEQMRTDQLQAAFVRPEETTALTYATVPGTAILPEPRPRLLTLQANVTSPHFATPAARRAVLRLVDPHAAAAVATGRSSDLVIPDPLPGTLDGPSGQAPSAPLTIGVVGDSDAVAAARVVADQLTASGVPATVSAAPPEEVSGALLPHGEVDLVVSWVDEAQDMLGVADRFGCPAQTRRSRTPDEDYLPDDGASAATDGSGGSAAGGAGGSGTDADAARKSADAADDDLALADGEDGAGGNGAGSGEGGAADGSAPESGAAASTTPAPSEVDGGNGPSIARGANLSGLCSPEFEALLEERGTSGGPDAAVSIVGAEAVELPIVHDATLTVIGPGMRRDEGGHPSEWPSAPQEGVFMTAPDWVRVDAEERRTRGASRMDQGPAVRPEDEEE
ncbi:ABC transporter substrate-binding protein [Corynebacterium sp. 335C]